MTNKLSIGFIGTRGIPNEYGGYEAVVQELAPRLAARGHEVVVYCSSSQENKYPHWSGVRLSYHFDPEQWLGSAGQFIYDILANIASRRNHHQVIFHMGYTSDSIGYPLWDRKAAHITNMDGLEWKRTKYSKKTRQFLSYSERLAARKSVALIADNEGIKDYLRERYATPVLHISYGVEIPAINENGLNAYGLQKGMYDLIIARMVPENNLEMAIKAKLASSDHIPLVLFGNSTPYRDELMTQYGHRDKIVFKAGNFDKVVMDSLRHYCRYYIHGHSVGGTNPSLLEAMAAKASILAHDNPFNRSVLNDGGLYFSDDSQLRQYFDSRRQTLFTEQPDRCIELVTTNHQWDKICDSYEQAAYTFR